MSVELAIPVVVSSLSDLTERIQIEHRLVQESLQSGLVHAIRAGDALIEAKSVVPQGDWLVWLTKNVDVSESAAQIYMRLSKYQEQLPSDVGVTQARFFLRGLPKAAGFTGYSDDIKAEARKLRATSNMSYVTIAEMLDVSHSIVAIWCDKDYAQRHAMGKRRHAIQRKRERRALFLIEKESRRRNAAKAAGGAIHDAYSHLRLSAEALDKAIDEAKNHDVASSLRDARNRIYAAEDRISQALDVS